MPSTTAPAPVSVPLTEAQLQKLATLSRLEFTPADLARIGEDLNKIVTAFAALAQVDTSNVKPLYSVHETFFEGPIATPERADDVTQVGDPAAYQSIAPKAEMGFYVVPKVIE